MPRTSFPVEQLLTVLAEAPRRIAEITVDVPATALHTAPRDEWSANDVLAHVAIPLRDRILASKQVLGSRLSTTGRSRSDQAN